MISSPLGFFRGAATVALSAWLTTGAASAQTQALDTTDRGKAADTRTGDASVLPEVVVTGNGSGAQIAAPASVLTGEDLLLERGSTLGETLANEPGVASSYFGPNVGRPIIRGLDGDRIRILQNGGATFDASALSNDHNAPIDPLAVERIEVLRGPAALRFSGSAQGGVVNVIDNHIPREPVAGPEGGATGRADASYATGAREKSGAAMVEAGTDRYALHVDAFDRRSGAVDVPIALECAAPWQLGAGRRICNSQNRAQGGAVGGTVFFERGYLGASAATYRSAYGTPAEDEATIAMHSQRYALEGLWRHPVPALDSLRAQWVHGDYHHTEFDAGDPKTTFRNRGDQIHLEARHRPWGRLQGSWGLDLEHSDFSALGEEAFVPPSRTRQAALYAVEKLGTDWGHLTFGARLEDVRVQSLAGGDDGRFTTGTRHFHPGSAALGGLINLTPAWSLTGNLSHTRRAPKDYELFANGPHVATGTWETGNPGLHEERSTTVDLGAHWKDGPHRFAVTAFASRYGNFIGLLPTGASADDLPVYAYAGVQARFVGLESTATVRLLGAQGIWQHGATAERTHGSVLDLDLRADAVRATNQTTGEPLPLIPPARVGATLRWRNGPWGARIGAEHALAQNRVPEGNRATGGYTLWNAALTYEQKVGRARLQWYARADNLTDRLAYSATSILTQTVFPAAPLPGRSLRVGLQAWF